MSDLPSRLAAPALPVKRAVLPPAKTLQIQKVDLGPLVEETATSQTQPAIPHMTNWIAQGEKTQVWQMGAADLEELLETVLPVFSLLYPEFSDGAFRAYAMSCIGNPRARLLRSDAAFGLALAEQSLYEPRITVRAVWVLSKNNQPGAHLEIFRALAEWAKSIHACSFICEAMPGGSLKTISDQLGVYTTQASYIFPVENLA